MEVYYMYGLFNSLSNLPYYLTFFLSKATSTIRPINFR